MRCESIRLLAWKGLTDAERYGQPGPEGSLVKWLWSDTNQRLTQLAADVIGPEALTTGTSWSYELLRARGNTIEGGTTEVLKNIVAERVLGLPRLKVAALGMDFGLTDDQRDIQRTARDLLAERAKFARVREHAEAGTTDTALWRELCELGWPGIAISEEYGGQGLGTIELVDPVRGARARGRAGAVPAQRDGGVRDRAGGLAGAARALAAGACLGRDDRRACERGRRHGGARGRAAPRRT